MTSLRGVGRGLVRAFQRRFIVVHQWLYERTGGAVGHRLAWVPCLVLYTTGRRTGARRASVLAYARAGDGYAVVASNSGADRPPAWLLNVRAEPGVEVLVGRSRHVATARVVEPGDADYDRLWQVVNDNNGNRYRAYQARTSRQIPVVVLTPDPDRAAPAAQDGSSGR